MSSTFGLSTSLIQRPRGFDISLLSGRLTCFGFEQQADRSRAVLGEAAPPGDPRKTVGMAPVPPANDVEEDVKALEVHLTGFGKFAGVPDNPTQRLVESVKDGALKDLEKAYPVTIASSSVLQTSAEYARDAVTDLHAGLTIKSGSTALCLHLGVDKRATAFNLERRAFNEADFPYLDERGQSLKHAEIVAENGGTSHSLQTDLPLVTLVGHLRERGFPVKESFDAGRFVCNWTYYLSLDKARTSGAHALFVHVPAAGTIPVAEQVRFLTALLEEISAVLAGAKAKEDTTVLPVEAVA